MSEERLDKIKENVYTRCNIANFSGIGMTAPDKEELELLEEIEKLNNIINELEKWLEERLEKLDINGYDDDVFNGIELALYKLQELKESEPSFEEMVNFVENVYQDIKNQSTLDEELKEERERIAKIVDDFKGVDKE